MIDAALAINAAASDSLAGDFNGDGTVDAADYTVWRDGLGTDLQSETTTTNGKPTSAEIGVEREAEASRRSLCRNRPA